MEADGYGALEVKGARFGSVVRARFEEDLGTGTYRRTGKGGRARHGGLLDHAKVDLAGGCGVAAG